MNHLYDIESPWNILTKLEKCPCDSNVIIRKQKHLTEIEEWCVWCPSCRSITSFAGGETEEETAQLWNERNKRQDNQKIITLIEQAQEFLGEIPHDEREINFSCELMDTAIELLRHFTPEGNAGVFSQMTDKIQVSGQA